MFFEFRVRFFGYCAYFLYCPPPEQFPWSLVIPSCGVAFFLFFFLRFFSGLTPPLPSPRLPFNPVLTPPPPSLLTTVPPTPVTTFPQFPPPATTSGRLTDLFFPPLSNRDSSVFPPWLGNGPRSPYTNWGRLPFSPNLSIGSVLEWFSARWRVSCVPPFKRPRCGPFFFGLFSRGLQAIFPQSSRR